MFEIKFVGQFPRQKPDFWNHLPKEISLILAEEIPESDFYLFYEQNRLHLGFTQAELKGLKPLSFDWEEMLSQLRKTLKKRADESMFKGLALAKTADPLVADATLGTGKDAVLMLFLGAKVDAYERNPWVYLLALDAHARLSTRDRMTVHFGQIQKSYPFIYFDPMFPEKKKSALPPKEMQIFKLLVGEDADQISVGEKLWSLCEQRLLVKRPNFAEPLFGKPHMSYESKLMRLDAYVK